MECKFNFYTCSNLVKEFHCSGICDNCNEGDNYQHKDDFKAINMSIKEILKKHNLSNKDLAECLNMSYGSFANSTAKKRYEAAFVKFYQKIKEQE